jgi:hypothetical protein
LCVLCSCKNLPSLVVLVDHHIRPSKNVWKFSTTYLEKKILLIETTPPRLALLVQIHELMSEEHVQNFAKDCYKKDFTYETQPCDQISPSSSTMSFYKLKYFTYETQLYKKCKIKIDYKNQISPQPNLYLDFYI